MENRTPILAGRSQPFIQYPCHGSVYCNRDQTDRISDAVRDRMDRCQYCDTTCKLVGEENEDCQKAGGGTDRDPGTGGNHSGQLFCGQPSGDGSDGADPGFPGSV